MPSRSPTANVVATFALFAIYFATAKLGLSLAPVSGFATLVWPPAGIALSALFLFGSQLWPGVFLGALVVNLVTGAPVPVALGMASGNTLEAVIGAHLLQRAGFRPELDRLSSVLALIVLGAFGSTLVSATIGVGSLLAGGLVEPGTWVKTWRAWWLGDATGDLIISPLLFVLYSRGFSRGQSARQPNAFAGSLPEAIGLVSLVALAAWAILTDWVVQGNPIFPRPYLLFPALMVVAVRLGQPGLVVSHFLIAATAVYATATGQGRFGMGDLSESLLLTQVFLGVLIISQLLLAALASERMSVRHALQESLRARDQDLQALREEREIREKFVAALSHDLRNPLSAAYTSAQLFRKVPGVPDSGHRYANRILSSLDRAERMIQDLLDANHLRAGQRLPLQIEPAELSSVLQDAVDELALVHGDRFLIQGASAPVEGYWCRRSLLRLIDNLAVNAVKYGAAGAPITIRIEREGAGAEAHVRLSIHNEGAPMPEEDLTRIFEPFQRGRSALTGNQKGWGLGLALVRGIAEAHGGSISVRSLAGEGTTFTATLPLDCRGAGSSIAAAEPA